MRPSWFAGQVVGDKGGPAINPAQAEIRDDAQPSRWDGHVN